MATVKRSNVPPTHPTVWVGLAIAVVGLLLATYAYTGARVYDIVFAFIALGGAVLALVGILVAAWGRSVMAARASRSRRALMHDDALAMATVAGQDAVARSLTSEEAPTVAAPKEKKRISFALPTRKPKKERQATKEDEKAKKGGAGGSVFAFKRRAPPVEMAADDPRNPEVAAALGASESADVSVSSTRIRLTLKCPQCATTFTAEGARPFAATCPNCAFSADV